MSAARRLKRLCVPRCIAPLGASLLSALAAGLALCGLAAANHSVVTLVSTADSTGNGAFRSLFLGASGDGTRVFFRTDEQLLAEDTDVYDDIYERSAGSTTRLSYGIPGSGNLAAIPNFVAASKDGTHVLFEDGQAMVTEDLDTTCEGAEGTITGCYDVYERSNGSPSMVSTGPIGTNAQFHSYYLASSEDAARVFFHTRAAMVPGDTDDDLDVYERSSGATAMVSTGPNGGNGDFDAQLGGISADGTHAFIETAESLVAADTDSAADVYERAGGSTTLVSEGTANIDAHFSGSSRDGSRVFFETEEALVGGDGDTAGDVYERAGGSTSLLSVGGGTRDAGFRAASPDGLRVLLATKGQLVAGDTDSASDVYQRFAGSTTLLSTGPSGGNANVDALFQGASLDAARVFLATTEALASGDTDGRFDVYERFAGTTTLVSTGPSGGNGAFDVTYRDVSDDGKRVFFETMEPLMGTDTDTFLDVYERSEGATTHLSTGTSGTWSFFGGASDDGTRVFFHTGDALTGADTDTQTDVYETAVKSTYVRPRGATPLLIALTLAYNQCTSPNRQHVAALSYGSCSPPVPASANLTVGTPDANGAVSNNSGAARLDVCPVPGCAAPNVKFDVKAADVRCKAGVSTCAATNSADGADYTGELVLDAPLRITDKYSGSVPQDVATVVDIPFQVPLPCTGTPDTTTGSSCSVAVTANSVVPGSVQNGARAIWEAQRVVLYDGGPDGVAATAPNDPFMVEGLFLP